MRPLPLGYNLCPHNRKRETQGGWKTRNSYLHSYEELSDFAPPYEKKYHRKLTDHEESILRTAERLLSRKAHKASAQD